MPRLIRTEICYFFVCALVLEPASKALKGHWKTNLDSILPWLTNFHNLYWCKPYKLLPPFYSRKGNRIQEPLAYHPERTKKAPTIQKEDREDESKPGLWKAVSRDKLCLHFTLFSRGIRKDTLHPESVNNVCISRVWWGVVCDIVRFQSNGTGPIWHGGQTGWKVVGPWTTIETKQLWSWLRTVFKWCWKESRGEEEGKTSYALWVLKYQRRRNESIA